MSGLSELSKQLRSLQAKNEAQNFEIARLEKQVAILSDLQNVSVADLKNAMDRACQASAHEALRLQIKQLESQLDQQKQQQQQQRQQQQQSSAPSTPQTPDKSGAHRMKIVSLELQIGELEEMLQAKGREVDRLYENHKTEQLSLDEKAKKEIKLWKKRYKSFEEQSKLQKAQQQARIWVLEEQLKDLHQQLSSLYVAFDVLQQEHQGEVQERKRLESFLQDADAQVAKSVDEKQMKHVRSSSSSFSQSSSSMTNKHVANQKNAPSSSNSSPPDVPTQEQRLLEFQLQHQQSQRSIKNTPVTPPHNPSLYSPSSSPQRYDSTAATSPQKRQSRRPSSHSQSPDAPIFQPHPISSPSQTSLPPFSSSLQSSPSWSQASDRSFTFDTSDQSPLHEGTLLVQTGIPKRWCPRGAAIYPGNEAETESCCVLVLTSSSSSSKKSQSHPLRPGTTRIGRYSPHEFGLVLSTPTRTKKKMGTRNLYLAAHSLQEFQEWTTVLAASGVNTHELSF